MEILSVESKLKSNSYPGRGIIIGKSANGKYAAAAYFIMGRSENSRNRIFVKTDKSGIRTQAFDESKVTDPSLIIYNAVRVLGNKTIVTNGDQTDTIYTLMNQQMTFEESLRTREFEPDKPNYTPRISGIIKKEDDGFNYALSILKTDCGNPDCCVRNTFSYKNPIAGTGHFIHTYGDGAGSVPAGEPLPSFEGEPVKVSIPDDIDKFADMLWCGLNEENKVSLWVRYISLEDDTITEKIINKNEQYSLQE